MGGSHWCAFYVKNKKKTFYFDSFGRQPDKSLLNQLTESLKNHNYKIHDTNSRLCGSYCLYSFFLTERMNYYKTNLPPFGDSFMYIETIYKNHGKNVFVSFERTDIVQNSKTPFYYNRFSILTNDSL